MPTKPTPANHSLVELSFDGGATWGKDRACSERIQVDALVRGLREFVTHHTRAGSYPQGMLVRWRGEVLP